jgi:putative ABC transport system permease protein
MKSNWIKYLVTKIISERYADNVLGDMDEIYNQIKAGRGGFLAISWIFMQLITSLPKFVLNSLARSKAMFKNYLKITMRNLLKHIGYSIINILGLAIGIACCIFIFLFIFEEINYDRYHKDHQRIYRVAEDIKTKTANRIFAPIAFPAGPALKENFPQVEYAARIMRLGSGLVQYEDKRFYESKRFLADNEIFRIFSIPFMKGNRESALIPPGTLVVTNRIASKYFGNTNPIGKMLKINQREFEITGVVADTPSNTHFKFDFLISLNTVAKRSFMTNWHNTMAYTYIKLKPNVDVPKFAMEMRHIANKFVGDKLKSWGEEYRFFLQPLKDIHLYSNIRFEMEPPGNAQIITIFTAVGLLILFIACINFMNLATAQSASRAREVGLRKVVGGQKTQLIIQFLSESMLITLCSLFLAIGCVAMFMPYFNSQISVNFSRSQLFEPQVLLMLLTLAVVTGLLAGTYPALFLSRFNAVDTLKTSFTPGSSKMVLRKILVVLQFSISIILIVCTIVVYQQLGFMKDRNLGFSKEQKLVIPFRGGMDLNKKHEFIKNEFTKIPAVQNATFSSQIPGRKVSNFSIKIVGEENDRSQSMFHLYYDPDFLPNYDIKIIAGRGFDKKLSTDKGNTFLINRAALKAFGWNTPQQALGKILQTGRGGRQNKIIGVTEDFHYRGLQYKVEPLVMEWSPETFGIMTLTINTKNLSQTLTLVKKRWEHQFSGYPFDYYFLDEDFNRQYQTEKRTSSLFGIFTFLGQFIACLGLLGLATFSTQQRTKEIGIRKVLGASSSNIVYLLSKEFAKWVLLANFIAWPVAYFSMKQWLLNFAFRTDIQWTFFIIAGVIVLVISIFTVIFQCLKAAYTNPVKGLKYE